MFRILRYKKIAESSKSVFARSALSNVLASEIWGVSLKSILHTVSLVGTGYFGYRLAVQANSYGIFDTVSDADKQTFFVQSAISTVLLEVATVGAGIIALRSIMTYLDDRNEKSSLLLGGFFTTLFAFILYFQSMSFGYGASALWADQFVKKSTYKNVVDDARLQIKQHDKIIAMLSEKRENVMTGKEKVDPTFFASTDPSQKVAVASLKRELAKAKATAKANLIAYNKYVKKESAKQSNYDKGRLKTFAVRSFEAKKALVYKAKQRVEELKNKLAKVIGSVIVMSKDAFAKKIDSLMMDERKKIKVEENTIKSQEQSYLKAFAKEQNKAFPIAVGFGVLVMIGLVLIDLLFARNSKRVDEAVSMEQMNFGE